ncbi:MAG: hypothetical protein BA871_08975 [Desulfuromonadales bacterium C00003096]|nr:MAG: hypothetical protein BA871_08975 [Desulfuromonadales bacterium C00003096]
MPRGDRTGPLGRGQLSGRQLGYCADYDVPGYMQGEFFGCGSGRGRGRAIGGRGMAFRCGVGRGGRLQASGFGATSVSFVDEASQLKSQMDGLEQALAALRRQFDALVDATKE